ncbi:hypothetical protein MTO96_021349 [Rhipicephalus appendiculatus]
MLSIDVWLTPLVELHFSIKATVPAVNLVNLLLPLGHSAEALCSDREAFDLLRYPVVLSCWAAGPLHELRFSTWMLLAVVNLWVEIEHSDAAANFVVRSRCPNAGADHVAQWTTSLQDFPTAAAKMVTYFQNLIAEFVFLDYVGEEHRYPDGRGALCSGFRDPIWPIHDCCSGPCADPASVPVPCWFGDIFLTVP